MFVSRLPALRDWPVPGRKLAASVRALWTEADNIHAWHDERERQAYLKDFAERRVRPPFAGHLRIF